MSKPTVEANGRTYDAITQPQEWIDGLVAKYAPNSHDVDVSIQNMGQELEQVKQERDELVAYIEQLGDLIGEVASDPEAGEYFHRAREVLGDEY